MEWDRGDLIKLTKSKVMEQDSRDLINFIDTSQVNDAVMGIYSN